MATNQEEFLANDGNKSRFITMLTGFLRDGHHTVVQAMHDADTDIVSTAIQLASGEEPVMVITDDTDIMILLVCHFRHGLSDIYMRSEHKRGQRKGLKLINIRVLREEIGDINSHILFVHACGGCDTTAALYGQGKVAIL